MRLRARLLFLIGTALLPAVAVQVHVEEEARAAREAARTEEATRLVRLVAADLESVVEAARQFLSAVAHIQSVARGDATTCSRALIGLRRDVPRYASFSVIDGTGRVVCGAIPGLVGGDVSGQSHVRLAQREGRFVVGDFTAGPGSGQPSLQFALPLDPARHGRDGLVTAALDLGWLDERLAAVPLPPGGTVQVADRNGTLLSRWPEPDRHRGRPMDPEGLRLARAGEARVTQAVGPDGVRRLLSHGALGPEPQRLLVGIGLDPGPGELAAAAASRRAVLLMVGGGLLALLLGLIFARRFMERPVEALLATMERWRAGDTAVRAGGDPRLGPPDDMNEFTRIATAFDQAVEAVETRGLALRESEARFRQITEASEDVLYIAEPRRRRLVYVSPAFERVYGRPLRTLDSLFEMVHPEDRDRLRALIAQSPDLPFDTEYRVRRPDGSERRIRDRRYPVPGSATGRVVGVASDVTAERQAAERQILLAREVDHRAKNILAVVQSILRLTRADSPRAFADAVQGRVTALALAHELLAKSRWVGVDLMTVLQEECAPYAAAGGRETSASGRCLLEGPGLRLGPEAVQSVAMVVHELATNSAKHGALSVRSGVVRIRWELAPTEAGADWLRLTWTETGGPPIRAVPERAGFGSRVVAATVERQLGGEVHYDWEETGLRCRIAIPAARLLQEASESGPRPPRLRPVEDAGASGRSVAA